METRAQRLFGVEYDGTKRRCGRVGSYNDDGRWEGSRERERKEGESHGRYTHRGRDEGRGTRERETDWRSEIRDRASFTRRMLQIPHTPTPTLYLSLFLTHTDKHSHPPPSPGPGIGSGRDGLESGKSGLDWGEKGRMGWEPWRPRSGFGCGRFGGTMGWERWWNGFTVHMLYVTRESNARRADWEQQGAREIGLEEKVLDVVGNGELGFRYRWHLSSV
ncbi:hypothetical protein LZ32DRAFT_316565 [Colletotrichum eremochloae]|nr:hypothetical protein LZ32DRAFT_316565 [Colletotrichum eremochloae]